MNDQIMWKLEEHLHTLIEYVAWNSRIELPEDYRLPTLMYDPLPINDDDDEDRRGFAAIPGYYGGVNYRYEGDNLKCVSFCRVCGGSEVSYVIMKNGIHIMGVGEQFTPVTEDQKIWFDNKLKGFLDQRSSDGNGYARTR